MDKSTYKSGQTVQFQVACLNSQLQPMDQKSEGVYKELTISNLVFVQDEDVQLPISINLPENVVPGSATAYVTAVGDPIGFPLQNLKDWIQKPCGSGEQSLAHMAIIPLILDYLNATKQLDDKTYEEAKALMSEGYFHQLPFASGGGYRTFPNPGEQTDPVLTAATYKTFEQTKKHIFIDEDQQQQTLASIEKIQNPETGCFEPQNSERGLQLSAYIIIDLLEGGLTLDDKSNILNRAMNCLKTATKSEQSLYTQALMLCAFTLANDHDYREAMLQSLMAKAKINDGATHWEREDMPKRPEVPFFSSPYPSAEEEIAAHMLLSMAAAPNITQEQLTTIIQIAMWLVRQMGPHGNFRSPKGTAVGLQALMAFAQLLPPPNPSQQHIVVRRDNEEVATMDLSQDKRLVVHRASLPDTSGNYDIAINGTGYFMIQTTVGYNIPVPKENSAFSLSLSTSADSCVNGEADKITLTVSVSYHGVHNQSSMALLTIAKMSGYSADSSSLTKLVNDETISKFEETQNGEVVLYMKNVTKEPRNYVIYFFMNHRVLHRFTSTVIVSNYLDNGEIGYASYKHPCAGAS